MELIDLINHVKANVEAGKAPEHGLLCHGLPFASVLRMDDPGAYSLAPVYDQVVNVSDVEGILSPVWIDAINKLIHDRGYRHVNDITSLEQQRMAWKAVVEVLDELSPGWRSLSSKGLDAAVEAIRKLAINKFPLRCPNKSLWWSGEDLLTQLSTPKIQPDIVTMVKDKTIKTICGPMLVKNITGEWLYVNVKNTMFPTRIPWTALDDSAKYYNELAAMIQRAAGLEK